MEMLSCIYQLNFSDLKVFINNREIVIFRGATVGDAVLNYSVFSYKKLKTGYLSVIDRFGFRTEPDGPLMEGQHFLLKVTSPKTKNHTQN
jgi:hypothetical protein